MKNTNRILLSILVLMLSVLTVSNVSAQRFMRQSRILGWADDNNYLMFDKDDEGNQVVMSVNVKTGKKKVYDEYRDSQSELSDALPSEFSMGFGSTVNDDQKSVVLQKDNDLWYFKLGDEEVKRLTQNPDTEDNPMISPEGNKVAFTRNKELYVIDIESGKETRLTFDATDRIYNGWASWVYFEEILGRGSRYSAFWWSPDGEKIAYLHTDDNPVPLFIINRIDEQDGLHGLQEVVPYPKPGDPNPNVKMGIVDVNSTETVWVKTDDNIDQYIAWPSWTPDSKKLMIQVLNRDQNDMKFILADVNNGDFKEVYSETRDSWIDFFTDVHIMKDGSGFVLRSSRSDWNNLYYYNWEGGLVRQLTDFDWRISSISRVDENNRVVYFSGTGGESTDNHFFKVGLDGTGLVKFTKEPGSHSCNVSPNGKYVIDTWSNINTPTTMVALDATGNSVRVIEEPAAIEFDPTKNARSELVRIPATDGFMLPAIITYPLNFDENKKYPVVFTIYGGPDAGNVRNSYMGNRTGWYAENNIITISVDHRASGHFGKKGLDYMHRNLGKWEMLDYIEAVKWLRGKPFVDPERMGITGSSYGGYTTAMALTNGADYWTHGVASSSVTDWRLYDNVYTERFMDRPQDNPEGYKVGSVLTYTENFKGKLLIIHGMEDDNVHMQNSVYLISKLQDEGKMFDMMIYPGGRHGWGGAKSVHNRTNINKYWLKWFFGEE
ncbi:MAG TPA: S9 family peptidase [Bacteroidales bacterium]|nr:S9 family peptidase [Bacteroidales bacterium]